MLNAIYYIAGIAFGFILIFSGVSNYDVIREMFLFESFHLYGVLMIGVGTTFVAYQLLERLKVKSIINQKEIEFKREMPNRNHIIGGLLAGAGWAVTGACPGPALAQIGFGTMAGIFTAFGIFAGIYAYGISQED